MAAPEARVTGLPASHATVDESAPVMEKATWPPGTPWPTADTLAVKVAGAPDWRFSAFEVTSTLTA